VVACFRHNPSPFHPSSRVFVMVASSFHHTKHFYRPPRFNTRYDNASFIGAKVGKKTPIRLTRWGGNGRVHSPAVIVEKAQQTDDITHRTKQIETPECQEPQQVATFRAEPVVTPATAKPLATQPDERAQGDGWNICNPTEEPDWGVVGCDSGSCFLFLYNENRHAVAAQEQAPQEPPHQQQTEARPETPLSLPRPTSCGGAWERVGEAMSQKINPPMVF